MKELTLEEAVSGFRSVIIDAQIEPVTIKRPLDKSLVIITEAEYKHLRAIALPVELDALFNRHRTAFKGLADK